MGDGTELLVKQRELVVHEGARGDCEPRRLFGERRQDAGVAMPLIDRRIGRQTIEVAAAVNVPEPDAEATGEYDIERLVITRAVFALEGVIAVGRRRLRLKDLVATGLAIRPCNLQT